MKNLNEIKMLATTLPIYDVVMAMPDEDPPEGDGGEEDPE